MFDPLYPLFSVACFFSFTLVLIPLPWHFQAWNSGTCFYIMWAALVCLTQFVNSVVWANDVINRAPVWCDITIRITMAASVGIPAASLCINRRLYRIASVKTVSVSIAEKRRAVMIDALICVLFPLVFVALQYIVQGHRFDIFEQIGCAPALYNSIPMYFLSMMWPPLIGLTSAVYGILSLRAFIRRRAAFNQFLSAHNSLTPSRYLRLMALAAADILLTTPLGIFSMVLNLTATPVQPWISFSDTHFDFGRVEQVPAILWRSNHLILVSLEFTRWSAPVPALVFFAFFGFAAEARKNYALAFGLIVSTFWRIMLRLGVQRPSSGFFAPKSTVAANSASRGFGYTKPPPSGRSATNEDISLPAYSPSATTGTSTDSFTNVGDLKRAASYATQGSSSTTSRYVEGFPLQDGKLRDEEKALSIYEPPPLGLRSPSPPPTPSSAYVVQHLELDPETPGTATSFATSSTDHVLPPHVGWHARPYPVDAEDAEDSDGTVHSACITPPISTSTLSRFSYPQTHHEQLSRGPRSLL